MWLLRSRAVMAAGVGVSVACAVIGLPFIASIVAVALFALTIRHLVPALPVSERRGWQLLTIAAGAWLGEAVVRTVHGSGADTDYPVPSPADLFLVGAYGCLVAAGLAFARSRSRRPRREDTTDAMIVAAGWAVVTLSVLLSPHLSNGTVPGLERGVTLVATMALVALVGVTVSAAFGPGARNRATDLLVVSATVAVAHDLTLRGELAGWPGAGTASAVLGPMVFVTAAAAAAHVTAREVTAPTRRRDPGGGRRRLLLLAGSLLIGPTLLVASEFGADRIDPIGVICGSALLALLVLRRMTDLVRAKERTSDRERHLRDNAGRLAAATDQTGVLRAALDGALDISRLPSTSRAAMYRADRRDLGLVFAQGVRSPDVVDNIPRSRLVAAGVELDTGSLTLLEESPALDVAGERDRHVLVIPITSRHGGRFVAIVTQERAFAADQVISYESFAAQVGLALDGVELREASHQRRSNRRFRALVENSSDVVLVLDDAGRVTFASPTVDRLLGREESSLRHAAVTDLVFRPDQVAMRRVLAAPARPGEEGAPVEVRLVHGSGELRWFEVEARDLTGETEVGGIVITARDISDRRRAEAQLVRSEARFRLVVQNSSDGVAIIDSNSLITYVSPSLERMLGFSASDVMGRNLFELLPTAEATRLKTDVLGGVGAIDGQTTEVRIPAGDGRDRALEVGISDMRSEPEVDGIVLNVRDVTERRDLEADLRYQARHDDLTGLANRVLFTERVAEAVQRRGQGDDLVAVLFIDLDDFKLINDSLGHVVGDLVLVEVATKIQSRLRRSDLCARLGSDDFAVLVGGRDTEAEIADLATAIRDVLAEPLVLGQNEFRLSATVGIAIDRDAATSAVDLLRSADAAVHVAKEAGKNRQIVFEAHMQASASEELATKNALIRAVDNSEFVLHYQPIIDLGTSRIMGVEALIRWEDPDRGMISPASFIPVAEESGLIRPIGMWVAAQAAQDLARWRAMGFDIYCSVNVSGRQMDEEGFAERFVEKIVASGVDPTAIVVELTESILAADGVRPVFDCFHEQGFRLALDDFGTGYSAFQYLQAFKIDLIKIDRSFVQAMNTEDDAGVVEAVLDVANRIGAETVAEGIETVDELRCLKELGVDLGQGYYFARPVPAARLEELLADDVGANVPARAT